VIRAHQPGSEPIDRRFPIRLWYPSQHLLLRQNPLPRSQFGSRRRFPRAASQRKTVVRLACRGQRRRGPWTSSFNHGDRKAALKLMRKLLKKQGVTPATIVTDKLGSYSHYSLHHRERGALFALLRRI
jgi:hypothetical protein